MTRAEDVRSPGQDREEGAVRPDETTECAREPYEPPAGTKKGSVRSVTLFTGGGAGGGGVGGSGP